MPSDLDLTAASDAVAAIPALGDTPSVKLEEELRRVLENSDNDVAAFVAGFGAVANELRGINIALQRIGRLLEQLAAE